MGLGVLVDAVRVGGLDKDDLQVLTPYPRALNGKISSTLLG